MKKFLLSIVLLVLCVCSPLQGQQTQVIQGNVSGFNYRGAWTASTAYSPNDIFTFNNATYEVSAAFTSTTTFDATKAHHWVTVPTNLAITTLNVGTIGGTGTGSWFLQGPCLSSTPVTPTTGPIVYCDANNGNQVSVKNTNGVVTVLGSGGGFTLTTTGSGGAAAFSGGILNIPAMTSGNIIATLGFTPISSSSTSVSFATNAIVNIPGTGKFTSHQLVADTLFSVDSTTQIQNLGTGTVNVVATNFNWNSSPIATQAWVSSFTGGGGGGGGGGIAFVGAIDNTIPVANVSGGVTTFQNSAFRDDGTDTYDSEPWLLSNSQYLEPTNTATSGANYQSNISNFQMSYWNGAAVTTGWQQYAWIASGASPATVFDVYSPPDLPNATVLYGINGAILATSSLNYNSIKFKIRGAGWGGSASVLDDWNWQGILGTGTNPTSTLTFSHTGSSGVASVQFQVPVSVTSGTAGINNNGAQWTGGTTLPGTCNVGDFYNLTSATSAGTAMQVCFPANTWNLFGTTGGSMTGTPAHVADAGAGSGSATVSFVTGANDGRGFVNVTPGGTITAGVGIVTIDFGGTYGTVPVCSVRAASATAVALGSGGAYVPSGTSTTTAFVITGITGLASGTTYQWEWNCYL